jgi:hypothetical protein
MKLLPLFLLPIVSGFAVASALVASENAEVIPWPASSPPSLAVGKRNIIFDEVPATITEFTGGGLRITSDSNGDWIFTGERQPRYSLLLRSFENQDVSLAFSIYHRKEFLPDLDAGTWQAYLAGVRQRCGQNLVSLGDGEGNSYFFGGPYREVIYTYVESAEAPPRMRREIFGLVGDRLIIATAEGAADVLPQLKLATDQFLARLNIEN